MTKKLLKKYSKFFLGVRYRRYTIYIRALVSLIPNLRGLIKPQNLMLKRVLIIYDLSVQPYSIGDFLLAQVAGLVLCENYNADYVDIAIIVDPNEPKSADPAFSSINKDNYLYYLMGILPVIQFNKRLGSVFLFNNKEQMIEQLGKASQHLAVWPSLSDVTVIKRYLHYTLFDNLVIPYWNSQKKIPEIEPIKFLKDWTNSFFKKIADNNFVVTVNFRNNKFFQQERNLNVEVWRDFFDAASKKYPVVFLVVCAKIEIDERLRSCPNVIFSKDYDTTMEQDLALISASDIHMGSSSGPATVAWFNSSKPYFIVRLTMSPDDFETPCLLSIGDGFYKFSFSTQFQTFFSGTETLDLLATKFDEMFQAVDHEVIKNRTETKITAIKSCLR